ncbi:MAG: alanine--tRNA ligase, partial [Erythrobacter sp.]|nr:alanine--tRNA ligase [Erythrobacter sp.]
MTSTNDIRRSFLDFFKGADHAEMPSAPLVPYNDPTLMFVNAGMVPFKNVFTGLETPPAPRATSSQKCVRAGGKHNDLDNVGYTARHHTFFEMLGNFSFGDYFKENAIEHAWTLLTKEWGLNPDRLITTVYHTDDEAFDLWRKIAGLPEDRIIRIATNDNFWSMGETGPCGPCSEIFYDHGDHIWGGPPGSPEEDGDRFVEIWNLVFMQFDQQADGTRLDLPKPSIDTGSGLERVAAVMQGVHNNYDIDTFKALIGASEHFTGVAAEGDSLASHRVIADHLRSVSFLMADGVLPSNEGRGYVLRRIMRRGMRHAHLLGAKDPLMHRLVPSLVTEMGQAFPELVRGQSLIEEVLLREETQFRKTLDKGLKLLDEATGEMGEGGELDGETAFKLYDTYGFPYDLTEDALRSRGIGVDKDGFDAAMTRQKEAARAAWKGSGEAASEEVWFDIADREGASEFTGYSATSGEGTVVAIVKDGTEVESAKSGESVVILTNQTPFYGTSGGQTGDTGAITTLEGFAAKVTDTAKPLGRLHAHHAEVEAGELSVGDTVQLAVDDERRLAIRANHSATHLVHAALRNRLGGHVTQKGSLVAEDRLRFDFSQPTALTREDIEAIEAEVNAEIRANETVSTRLMSPDDAVEAGALALFGEKYGDEVRTLQVGDFSKELCGGTHVSNTGNIGVFRLVSESAVAAGTRRIEAVTGRVALQMAQAERDHLAVVAAQFKVRGEEVPGRVSELATELKKTRKQLEKAL